MTEHEEKRMNSKQQGPSASCPSLCSSVVSATGVVELIADIHIQAHPVDPLNPATPPPGDGWIKAETRESFRTRTADPKLFLDSIIKLAESKPDLMETLRSLLEWEWTRSIDHKVCQS